MRPTSDDIDFRIVDLVERLATEFESDVGTKTIIDEVQRARDRLRVEHLDEADHLDTLEAIARDALAARRGGGTPRSTPPPRTPAQRRLGDPQ